MIAPDLPVNVVAMIVLKRPDHLRQGNEAVGAPLCFVFVGMGFAVSSLIV